MITKNCLPKSLLSKYIEIVSIESENDIKNMKGFGCCCCRFSDSDLWLREDRMSWLVLLIRLLCLQYRLNSKRDVDQWDGYFCCV